MNNYYVDLNHRDLLAVSGKDSELFLQGQLTCDLSKLAESDSCPGCICDNKGRVIASFTLWKLQHVYYLDMEAGLADLAEQHLLKYAVFYKSDIRRMPAQFIRFGLIGAEAQRLLKDKFPALPVAINQVTEADGNFLRLLDADLVRYEVWLTNTTPDTITENPFKQALPLGEYTDWQVLDQNQGLYRLRAEDAGTYTPEELNYDLLGHISFTKGCYTGQEIVARMHYRGKAKKRLYRLQIQSELHPMKKMKISTHENKTVGELMEVIELDIGQYQALAVANGFIQEEPDLYMEQLPDASIKLISQ